LTFKKIYVIIKKKTFLNRAHLKTAKIFVIIYYKKQRRIIMADFYKALSEGVSE